MNPQVDGSVLEQVHRIRDSYRQFLKGTSNLTAGHMLLMAYDGLFVRLHGDQAAMLEVKQNITTKYPAWSNVDVLQEAVGNQVSNVAYQYTGTQICNWLFYRE